MLKKTNQPEGALSLAKSGTIWTSKYVMVVTNYNLLNEIGKHESTQTQK